ncbi:hypothetical protein REPUB_Repub12eG0141600 [Reevesia pubescens]
MAIREPLFQLSTTLYHDPNPPRRPLCSQVVFVLRIRKFLRDDNGNEREDNEHRFHEELLLPEFAFGSNRHRNFVGNRLRQAGWHDQRSLGRLLDLVFSDAESILEKYKKKKKNFESRSVPRIIFNVKKTVRWEDDALEAQERALALSMQEAPKPVPATKESIQALQKVKLEGASTEDCIICMEQLSSGTDDQITSMPCSHLFHGDCIEQWLNTSHHCPLCRFAMPTDATL